MHESHKRSYYVPEYKIIFTKDKGPCDYCIIIPVINEGERIKNLLEKMHTMDIAKFGDLIIVDGGTTDGSLDEKFLKRMGVNSVLLKTGPGKLSSQLLCAYDFAIQRGYKGIITIDGNNKDDPAPIPAFIKKLEDGYDFVQASRFISGGKAENTPHVREFAIRFIHAPLLSLASGFKWTDTTQGFRAYSAKMLADRNIAIFRRIFSGYELLAYMSYIAPRLGFKCIEMPARRVYPKGKIPTKISSLRGNFDLLKVLFKTVLGFYNKKN